MRRCRTAIESQLSGAVLSGFGPHDVEQLRVALYCAERGLEEMINQANDPRWIETLPDDLPGIHHEHPAGPRHRPQGTTRAPQSLNTRRMRSSMPPRPPGRLATTTAPKVNDPIAPSTQRPRWQR